jgi:hypothetical protein
LAVSRGGAPHLRDAVNADHLAQIAFDQMHFIGGHRLHGDFDMHHRAGAMRPHAVRDQVALGEGLEQARQKTWFGIRIEHEADGDMPRGGRWIGRHGRNSGRTTRREMAGEPRLLRQPGR